MSHIVKTPCAAPPICGSHAAEPPVSVKSDDRAARSMSDTAQKSSWGGVREGAGRKPGPQPARIRVIQRSPVGPRWHVARILSRDGPRIMQDLLTGETRPGYAPRPTFGAYLPMLAVERTRAGSIVRHPDGKPEILHVPCYPGYAFVQFDRDTDPWGTLTTVDGVLGLIQTRSGIPIPLPPTWHENERRFEAKRMRLPDVALPEFAPGDQVRFVDGPMRGFTAAVQSDTGLTTQVSAQVFGREASMTVLREWLEAVT